MTEKPKRPTLSLKFPPKLPPAPVAVTPDKAREWKCKPCGAAFQVPVELGDEGAVRCPSCNAKLGLARDFRETPPNTPRLRARLVAEK